MRYRGLKWGGAAIAVALFAAQGSAAAAGLAPGDYKLGFLTTTTGPIAFAGVSYWRGAQLAAEEIEASHYLGAGTKITLVPKEEASTPERAIQDMHQFIADRSILATACCILSPVAGSLKPIVLKAQIPLVIYGATATGLPQPPYIYSVTILPGPKDVAAAREVAKTVKPKSVVYFLAADNDAFKARMGAVRSALEADGVKTAGVVNVLSADTDFTAAATQAMGLKPDMVLVYATQGPSVGIITALRQRGYGGTVVASDVLAPATIFQKMGEAVVGVPFPVAFSPTASDSPEAKAFAAAYEKKFGGAPDVYSAQGYETAWYVAQALKNVSGKPTRASLAQALSKVQSIDHNVYDGEKIVNGQAESAGTLIVAWTKDGKLEKWKP